MGAFTSDRDGADKVWVLEYPLTGDTPLPVSDTPKLAQHWSLERGAEIFSMFLPDLNMNAVSVETDPGFRQVGTEPLFRWSPPRPGVRFSAQGFLPYDVIMTPEGERFLFVQPVDQADSGEPMQPKINVVINWFEELRERVPVP